MMYIYFSLAFCSNVYRDCVSFLYRGRGTGGGLRMGEGVVDTQAGQINR